METEEMIKIQMSTEEWIKMEKNHEVIEDYKSNVEFFGHGEAQTLLHLELKKLMEEEK